MYLKGDEGGPLIGRGLDGGEEAVLLGIFSVGDVPCRSDSANTRAHTMPLQHKMPVYKKLIAFQLLSLAITSSTIPQLRAHTNGF